jgi:uncharacterized cupin superfamily protein
MLLYVTGPETASSTHQTDLYSHISSMWSDIAKSTVHPRSGLKCEPALTRLDLFLAAFAPEGLPSDRWYAVGELRAPLKVLIGRTFPAGPRMMAAWDPVGPERENPGQDAEPLATLSGELAEDPAQLPVDPRAWLVLAPPMAGCFETVFLSWFLRAEPYARLARIPEGLEDPRNWLAAQLAGLARGKDLLRTGLVTDLDGGAARPALTTTDPSGRLVATTDVVDLVSGLEGLHATREMIAPGEVYNRFHSHTASEELYIVLEGSGVIRVNERLLPIRAGQCFGKPANYGCATQLVNTGQVPLVFLDIAIVDTGSVDLCHYPEHGELFARFAGHRWFVPTGRIRPGAELGEVYSRRYYRK